MDNAITTEEVVPYQKNLAAFDRWLVNILQRIEGVYHELTTTGCDLKCLLAKTVGGSTTQVITRLISHLLKGLIVIRIGIEV